MKAEEHAVWIPTSSGAMLEGTLTVPTVARQIVLFAHGSGSSRHSPRNVYVAQVLHEAGLATLLIDLLTPDEEHEERVTRHLRFDIDFLAERLIRATYFLRDDERTQSFALGYFGASTGAAAALVAAARSPERIYAIVSRGGRPDLAGNELPNVRAPTLLIVGGEDLPVIEVNRDAFELLRCQKKFEIVPRASHLFSEPGTLERVARLSSAWFIQHSKFRTKQSSEEIRRSP